MFCDYCKESLFSEDKLKCANCHKVFHYFCCQVKNFRNMKPITKSHFKCKDCKEGNSSPSKDKDEENQQQIGAVESVMAVEMSGPSKDYFDLKFKEMVTTMSENRDAVLAALEERIVELETKLEQKDQKLLDLEERIDHLEIRARIANLEIKGIPETKDENVINIVEEIGKAIGVIDIGPGVIQVAHRVDSANRARGTRTIVAHMASRYTRNVWLQKYKDFKKLQEDKKVNASQINPALGGSIVYLNEHLTVVRKILLNDVKKYAKENQIKYVWVKDGFILIKKNDQEKYVKKIANRREFENYKIEPNTRPNENNQQHSNETVNFNT